MSARRGTWRSTLGGVGTGVRGIGVVVAALTLIASLPPTGAVGQARARPPASDTITLTLGQALRIAQAHNPDYQKAVNRTDENGADMRQAWFDQVLPRASVNLFNTGYSGNLYHVGTGFYNNPIQRSAASWDYSSSTSQSLQLSWRIQGAEIVNAFRSQKLTNESRDVAAAGALTTTQIQVRMLYTEALSQRHLLEAEREVLASKRIDEQVTKRLFSLAQGSQVDVLKAELDVETQTQVVQQQRATFEKALLSLRTELGDPGLPPFRLDSVPLPIFDPSSLEAASLVALALKQSPDVQAARSQVDLARVAVSDSRSYWWPTVTMSAYFGRTAQATQNDALFDPKWSQPADKAFSIGLSLPMLNDFFGMRQSQVQNAVALENAKEDARKQRLTTEQNVRSDLLDLRSKWQALQVAETSAQIGAKEVQLARAQYRIGTLTFQDLRTSVNDDATARRALVTARQDFVDALLDLEEAVGTTVGPTSPGGGDGPGGR